MWKCQTLTYAWMFSGFYCEQVEMREIWERATQVLFSNKSNILSKCPLVSTFHWWFKFSCVLLMLKQIQPFFSRALTPPSQTSSPLTVSLAPLSSQFCWTAPALAPSPSSAPAGPCPPRLPSSRRRNRPWTPRPRRSRSRSWRTNCCSLNPTPRLTEEQCIGTKQQSFSWLQFSAVTQTQQGRDVLISIGYIQPDHVLLIFPDSVMISLLEGEKHLHVPVVDDFVSWSDESFLKCVKN